MHKNPLRLNDQIKPIKLNKNPLFQHNYKIYQSANNKVLFANNKIKVIYRAYLFVYCTHNKNII